VYASLTRRVRNRVATLVNGFWTYLTFGSAIRLTIGSTEGVSAGTLEWNRR
jgi:hypothetical protein